MMNNKRVDNPSSAKLTPVNYPLAIMAMIRLTFDITLFPDPTSDTTFSCNPALSRHNRRNINIHFSLSAYSLRILTEGHPAPDSANNQALTILVSKP